MDGCSSACTIVIANAISHLRKGFVFVLCKLRPEIRLFKTLISSSALYIKTRLYTISASRQLRSNFDKNSLLHRPILMFLLRLCILYQHYRRPH
jgi:hypothetical protein